MAHVMKPDWLKTRIPSGEEFKNVSNVMRKRGLNTVCEEARCPNKAECWSARTATFMILGDVCTRNCGFCATKTGKTGVPVDRDEPRNVSEAASELSLSYVVLTCVDRDDLPDRGANHFAECIRQVRKSSHEVRIEVLIPDYVEGELKLVVDAKPDVIAHNIEVVRRLQDKARDSKACYEKSLRTLAESKKLNPEVKTKSSIMLGLGETKDEVLEAMDDLRAVGCEILVLGQYLQPTRRQIAVAEYVHPSEFEEYSKAALGKGFTQVVSSPLARTSYHAKEVFFC